MMYFHNYDFGDEIEVRFSSKAESPTDPKIVFCYLKAELRFHLSPTLCEFLNMQDLTVGQLLTPHSYRFLVYPSVLAKKHEKPISTAILSSIYTVKSQAEGMYYVSQVQWKHLMQLPKGRDSHWDDVYLAVSGSWSPKGMKRPKIVFFSKKEERRLNFYLGLSRIRGLWLVPLKHATRILPANEAGALEWPANTQDAAGENVPTYFAVIVEAVYRDNVWFGLNCCLVVGMNCVAAGN
ncbi:hypothetical protein AQUCO_03100070v1 [Aquilegia coerulea]|uniref:Uncharacterized protein n=1 Tax=Aquilegia coerulea TaxID=218851 RepID=A0A2G5D0M7_AQUCA|nr:hypothetical protein AQUCO_03100070v1 [Aquilegia coerulea]